MGMKVQTIARHLMRYWLGGVVLFFALLMFYTSSPVFGAQVATPTPDVKTVPPLELVLTPTNTAFPTVTPVVAAPATATPVATNALPTNAAPLPTVTRQLPDETDDEEANDGNGGNSPSGGGSAPSSGGSSPVVTGNNSSQPASTTPGVGLPARGLTGTVTSVVLNLRKNPGNNQSPIDTLFRGDVVQILGRNADGAWWLICCGVDAKLQGWVSAASIQPNFASSQANALIPLIAGQGAAVGASAAVTGTRPASATLSSLQVEMRPSPAFAWQGQSVAIQFVITNRGSAAVTGVRLRDHLPPTLRYVKAAASNQGQLQTEASDANGSIVILTWPRLAPGASVMATITVEIAPDTEAGSLIDNLALITADEQDDLSVGITLAMPPTVLPQFR